jgi:branched-chain amino acid transport system substrate-binding protein
MKKHSTLFWACLMLALSLAFISANALAQETLRVGALYPLSGSLALLGTHDYNGVELATAMKNERGGVLGKKITLIKADGPTPDAAKSETERLINVEKLKLIMGTYSSSLSIVASAVAERNKVIFFETGAIADPITQRGFKYVLRNCATASQFGNTQADFTHEVLAAKLGKPPKDLQVVIMHEDSLYGTAVGGAAEKRLKELGIKILAKESYNNKVTDMSSLVMKFKSLKPDIVVATCYLNDAILFQRQSKELNFQVKALVGGGGGHGILDFAKAVGNDANGVFSSDFPLVKNPAALDPKLTPPLKEVMERYKSKYGDYPDLHAMSAFTGAWVLYHYILPKAAGSIDPDAVRMAALQVDIPEGGTHMGWGVKYAGEGHPMQGTNLKAFNVMMQWQKGLNYCVWPKKYAEREMISVPLPPWEQR